MIYQTPTIVLTCRSWQRKALAGAFDIGEDDDEVPYPKGCPASMGPCARAGADNFEYAYVRMPPFVRANSYFKQVYGSSLEYLMPVSMSLANGVTFGG